MFKIPITVSLSLVVWIGEKKYVKNSESYLYLISSGNRNTKKDMCPVKRL